MDKDTLAIAKARAHYGEHLEKLQIAGLILSVSDPNGLTSFDLTGTAVLIGAVWDGARVTRMIVTDDSGGETALQAARSHAAPVPPAIHPNLVAAVPVYQVSAVKLEFSASDKDARQDVALVFRLDSDPAQNVLFKVDCILPKNETTASLMTFASPLLSLELLNHLNENSLYYSQQIWLSFDAGLLMIQLSPYKYDGKRLIEYIDPTPVSAAGNCLVFRWKDERSAEWKEWKRENFDETKVDVDLVALPTGGVFAEAIPGRFNSAEKLDISRFWNWQDSPIPIQAPEIAAIQAGQRQIAGTPQTGSLEPPVVSIQNAPALPDPTGMSAIVSALTAANIFRDMSGTAQTAALAQAALQASGQAAQAAMGQAGANMATAGQFQLELTKAIIGAALGIPTVPGPGLKNITTAGATINHGAKMDAAADSGTVNGPNPPPIDGGSSGGASGGSGGGGGGGAVLAARSRPSNEQIAFASTVAGDSGVAGVVLNALNATASTQPIAPPLEPVRAIAEFRGRSGPSCWSLDRAVVADRLTLLTSPDAYPDGARKGPRKLDQDHLNLCGVAAFFHIWLKCDPAAVVQYAIDLYEKGSAAIGTLSVIPHDELLQQSHRTMWPADIATDLMMMSALRDSENSSGLAEFRFRGRENEEMQGITRPDELAKWLRATGKYLDVRDKANMVGTRQFADSLTLSPDAQRDIAILTHTRMLTGPQVAIEWRQPALENPEALLAMAFPNHYIVLDGPITPIAGDKVELKFWCWADETRVPVEIDKATFEENFYGAVVAVK